MGNEILKENELRKFRLIITFITKKFLDICLYYPFLYLGGFAMFIRSKITGEDTILLVDTVLLKRLIKLTRFIGRVCDKIDGKSHHEKEVYDSWVEYVSANKLSEEVL